MSKIAFLYPGQGAQVAGMGKDFYEKSPLAKEVFDKSCEILGQDMKHICFEENELLDRTDYTQAALVTTCMAMTKEIMARGLTPDMTAGLSLGEYCAITTAGGMELEDAIKMVWLRGNLMHNAVPEGKGGMAAVLGLSGEAVNEAIAYMEGVYVANYNCPGQIVITGDKEAVENAAPALKEAGAKRVIPLNVSGPFHSLKRSRGEAVSGTFRSDIRRVKDSLCDKCGCKYRDRYDKNKRITKRTGLFLRFMGAECACHDSRRCGRFRRNRSGKDFERFYEKD